MLLSNFYFLFLVMSFDFDLILGRLLLFGPLIGYFSGKFRVQKLF